MAWYCGQGHGPWPGTVERCSRCGFTTRFGWWAKALAFLNGGPSEGLVSFEERQARGRTRAAEREIVKATKLRQINLTEDE